MGLRLPRVESRQQDARDSRMDQGRATDWTHALGVFGEGGLLARRLDKPWKDLRAAREEGDPSSFPGIERLG